MNFYNKKKNKFESHKQYNIRKTMAFNNGTQHKRVTIYIDTRPHNNIDQLQKCHSHPYGKVYYYIMMLCMFKKKQKKINNLFFLFIK